jgi:2'-5' RNA ligase
VPTIGVSVPIPEPWATELQDYRVGLGDETAAQVPTHITLVPPMEVDEAELPVIEKHLAAASADVPAYEILLRGTGTFRPVSEVVFVMLARGISQCEQLAKRLRSGPLERPLSFPYHPHVTVAHDLAPELLDRAFTELAGFTAYFTASAFCLYRHDPGTGWQPTREFPLQ